MTVPSYFHKAILHKMYNIYSRLFRLSTVRGCETRFSLVGPRNVFVFVFVIGKPSLSQKTCISMYVCMYRQSPVKSPDIKSCESIYQAKKEIKMFVKSLPVCRLYYYNN